ncbi:MAG: hypothetical protein QUV08_14415 [Parasphingorhabdus sp.]|nr:hypothetical protein [Parasphingorhabdus sp.]
MHAAHVTGFRQSWKRVGKPLRIIAGFFHPVFGNDLTVSTESARASPCFAEPNSSEMIGGPAQALLPVGLRPVDKIRNY